MKRILILTFLFAGVAMVQATQIFTVEDIDVSIQVPDNWKHDEADGLGYVLRPGNDAKQKIRMHLTDHKNISPKESLKRSAEKVKKMVHPGSWCRKEEWG